MFNFIGLVFHIFLRILQLLLEFLCTMLAFLEWLKCWFFDFSLTAALRGLRLLGWKWILRNKEGLFFSFMVNCIWNRYMLLVDVINLFLCILEEGALCRWSICSSTPLLFIPRWSLCASNDCAEETFVSIWEVLHHGSIDWPALHIDIILHFALRHCTRSDLTGWGRCWWEDSFI